MKYLWQKMICAAKKIYGISLSGLDINFNCKSAELSLVDLAKNARDVCDQIVNAVSQKVDDDGKRLACKKGCSACCSYLVPVSLAEAFLLESELQTFPDDVRQKMMRANLDCAQKILDSKLPSRFNSNKPDDADAESAASWYNKLAIKCPFLCNGECSIYKIRPLACREHLVEGSSRICGGGRGSGELVAMPLSSAQLLSSLTAGLLGIDEQSLPLPLALVWSIENNQYREMRWPVDLIEEITGTLIHSYND